MVAWTVGMSENMRDDSMGFLMAELTAAVMVGEWVVVTVVWWVSNLVGLRVDG